MNLKLSNRFFLILTSLIAFLLVWVNKENGFFWDTIQLASEHGNFYYSTNFSQLLLPVELDSGHIPAFGMYIALVWKIFGRSLPTSHLAMLPFALGIVWQLNNLCKRFVAYNYIGIALLLVFIDVSLMSQITLVSPDVPLIFFFLLALNSVLKNNKPLITISIFCLFLISMRGMMLSVCFGLIDIYINIGYQNLFKNEKIKILLKRALLYLPALALFVSFSVYHYHEKGWIGYHKDSPWADCFERTNFKGFLFNIGLLGWRILDFGRIGIWIVFIWLLLKYKSQIFKDKRNHILFFIFLVLLFLLPLNMLWAKNLMGYRYLMPIYFAFSLLTASILFSDFVAAKLKIILTVIWLLVVLSGNFWIYPPKIAKGWDSTLAHLPYYKLRIQAIDYLNVNKINFNEVDSFFPNYYPLDVIDLNNDKRSFDNFTIENKSKYIFYCNIFNLDDDVYDYMMSNYTSVKEFENNGIYILLMKKNK